MKSVVVVLIHNDTFLGVLFQGLIAGGLGFVVYGLVAWGLKSPEMIDFVASMQRKFFKHYQPSEVIAKDQTII